MNKQRYEQARDVASADHVRELEVEIATLRQRAIRAHQICNLARVTYPQISELDDDGCLHEAIHDILRVPMSGVQPHAPAAAARDHMRTEHGAALQRIGTALGLPAGSDLHTECVLAIEAMQREAREVQSLLPGVYYMDPPDGGDVTVLEQLRRMARDAARYRWLCGNCELAADNYGTAGQLYFGTYALGRLDDELDAAISAGSPSEQQS